MKLQTIVSTVLIRGLFCPHYVQFYAFVFIYLYYVWGFVVFFSIRKKTAQLSRFEMLQLSDYFNGSWRFLSVLKFSLALMLFCYYISITWLIGRLLRLAVLDWSRSIFHEITKIAWHNPIDFVTDISSKLFMWENNFI